MQIGVLGATGPAGRSLAARLASVGHDVVAGSREHVRAEQVVEELAQRWGERVSSLAPGTNAEAASAADLVVLATTWEAAVPTASAHAAALAGKPVVCMANGLERHGDEFRVVLPPAGSIALAVQDAAPASRVAAAFQLVPAAALGALDRPVTSDVVVCADDDDARSTVMGIITGIPDLGAFDGGSLRNSSGLESFAAILLTVNVRHRSRCTLTLSDTEAVMHGR